VASLRAPLNRSTPSQVPEPPGVAWKGGGRVRWRATAARGTRRVYHSLPALSRRVGFELVRLRLALVAHEVVPDLIGTNTVARMSSSTPTTALLSLKNASLSRAIRSAFTRYQDGRPHGARGRGPQQPREPEVSGLGTPQKRTGTGAVGRQQPVKHEPAGC